MIVDCFTFFNEFDLLQVRLDELSPYVDRFVVAEANRTHAGTLKPYYLETALRDHPSLEQIVLVKVELPECKGDRWALENMQRNALVHGLQGTSPHDTVLVGDVDEIPNMATWDGKEGVFRGDAYFYKVNLLHRELWNGTVAVKAWRFGSPYGPILPQDCRNFRDMMTPCGEGKHFSWLGDPAVKVVSFAHAELDTPDFVPDMRVHPGDKSTLLKVKTDEGWWPKGILRKEWLA